MAGDPVPVWQLADPEGTKVCRLDDEAIVFDPLSWETHSLNFVASEVIEALAAGPKDVTGLCVWLAGGESSATDVEEARKAIEPVVAQLESYGLIRATPGNP